MKNAFTRLALAVCVVALSAFAHRVSAAETTAAPQIGSAAPDFELKDSSGKVHRLSDYKGKIVVLEWINPTCPFVKRHYKANTMKSLAEKYAKDGVVWLAIDSSHFVTAEDAQKWIEQNKLSYPILIDADGKVGNLYGAKTTPHMFIVNKDGTLAYRGAIDDDPRGEKEKPLNYVDAALAKLVAGQAPETVETKPYGCSVKYKQ
ncbi:MAG: thioredoxin family protein [Candidatus Sumerlaea chitinivorans]|uniref:PPO candidate 1 n=1 Tax=Sumerlaea chitinivorans TaxID=2250252 RepID=A0A2Z4Y7V6_SUMC1|nr:PPO candidate 1 [Candidatus Sumerlaea chitinivorans]MCX7963028.1 thioredoxin family protein [Candidatus Sumerlaea chitinivorans]